MRNIKKSEAMILRDIALNGPATGYIISQRTGLSKHTSYESSKDLVDKGLLSVSVVGKTRAGMDKKEYSLTAFGLIHALTIIKPEEWQSVMKAWPDLIHLVTDKWDVFVNAGVEDLAMRRLKLTAREMFMPALMVLDRPVVTEVIYSAEIFSARFYCLDIKIYNYDDRLRWTEACKTDREIRKYLIESMKMNIFLYASEIAAAENMLDTLEANEDRGKRKPILFEDFLMRRLTF